MLILYVYIEPPFWLFITVTVFMLITNIEQFLGTQGLFGTAAGLLLVGAGMLGITQNEAIVLSVFAIVSGIGVMYRNIVIFGPYPPASVTDDSSYSDDYLQLIVVQRVFSELERQPRTVSELAKTLDLTSSRVSNALFELEQREIVRQPSKDGIYEPIPITQSAIGRLRLRLQLFGSWLMNPNKS
ncbi:hypothetical protein ACNS7O_08810 [Haloferacaceae archaeon DSL9]